MSNTNEFTKKVEARVINILKFFNQHYTILKKYEFNRLSDKLYLGNRKNRICRFCNLLEGETTFRSKAHVIPECFENISLFSNYECDACNQKFSILEDSFSKFTLSDRVFAKIRGKRKYPVYNYKGKRVQFDPSDNMFQIQANVNDDCYSFDQTNFSINLPIPPYIPRDVYKSLLRMALLIMPEDELINFKKSLSWIKKRPESDTQSFKKLTCVKTQAFVSDTLPVISAMLLKRKDPDGPVPYAFFNLNFSIYSYQIYLKSDFMDNHLQGKEIKTSIFPNSAAFFRSNKYFKYEILDLSSNSREYGGVSKHFYTGEGSELRQNGQLIEPCLWPSDKKV